MDHIRVWLKAERIAGEETNYHRVKRMLKAEIEEFMTPQKLRFLRARVLWPKACICHSRESILHYYFSRHLHPWSRMEFIRGRMKAERWAEEQASCNRVRRLLKANIEEIMTTKTHRFLMARVLCPKACICHSRESTLHYYFSRHLHPWNRRDHIRVQLEAEREAGEQANYTQVKQLLKADIEEIQTTLKYAVRPMTTHCI